MGSASWGPCCLPSSTVTSPGGFYTAQHLRGLEPHKGQRCAQSLPACPTAWQSCQEQPQPACPTRSQETPALARMSTDGRP